jgi:acyl-CoA dehydrogenase
MAWEIDLIVQESHDLKAMMQRVLHDVSARALQLRGSLGTTPEMPFATTEVHKATLFRLREAAEAKFADKLAGIPRS